jgi:hypothetical protein
MLSILRLPPSHATAQRHRHHTASGIWHCALSGTGVPRTAHCVLCAACVWWRGVGRCLVLCLLTAMRTTHHTLPYYCTPRTKHQKR